MDPEVLALLLDETLAGAVEALDQGAPVQPAPGRQYISHGEPAHDCDQLTVHAARITPKLVSDPAAEVCAIQHVITVVLTLVRCLPSAEHEQPTAEQLNGEARQLAIDGWAIWKHLTRQWTTGNWPTVATSCKAVKWRNAEPRGPLGQMAAWRIEFDVTL